MSTFASIQQTDGKYNKQQDIYYQRLGNDVVISRKCTILRRSIEEAHHINDHPKKSIERVKEQKNSAVFKNVSYQKMFIDKDFRVQVGSANNGIKQYKSFIEQLKCLNRKNHNSTNIKILLKTQYTIIHNLIHKYFNYKFYNREDQFSDVFLIWVDTYVTEEFVKRLKGYQRINHFPNSCQLGRKDLLANNLNAARLFIQSQYMFYPRTWVLPGDCQSFNNRPKQNKFYIVKPHANCQGRGIYLTTNPTVTSKDEVIIQQYIDNPLLIDGNKFDLRIYVLLKSLDPLRIYIYKEGLCRLATCKYVKPNQNNFKNEKMHLTNYAINKTAPNFIPNKESNMDNQGHKRSYSYAMKYLEQVGLDCGKIQQRIDTIIVKTIMSCYTKMLASYRKTREIYSGSASNNSKDLKNTLNTSQHYTLPLYDSHTEDSVCFELFGFDIMILQTGQPILLEVNHQPSLVTDSPLDYNIKRCLLMDTINLLNMQENDKDLWQQCQDNDIPFKYKFMQQKQLQSMGGYRRIYPLTHTKTFKTTQQQMIKIKQQIDYYEYFLNKFIFKECKILSTKYKAIGKHNKTLDLKSNEKTEITQRNNNRIHVSKYTLERADKQPISSSEKHRKQKYKNYKSIGLTFYNLFNDQKYEIKNNNSEQHSTDKQGVSKYVNLTKMQREAQKNLDEKYKKLVRENKFSASMQEKQKNQHYKIINTVRVNALQILKQKQEKSVQLAIMSKSKKQDICAFKDQQLTSFPNDFQTKFINNLIAKKNKKLPLFIDKNASKQSINSKELDLITKLIDQKQPLTPYQQLQTQLTMINGLINRNLIKKFNQEEYFIKNSIQEYKYAMDNSIREKVDQISKIKIVKSQRKSKEKVERLNKYRVYNFGSINQTKKKQSKNKL